MFKAVIFDLGNVLVQISYQRIFTYWSQKTGRSFEDWMTLKHRFIDPAERKYESGEIDEAEFRGRVMSQVGFKLADSEFDLGWNNIFVGINPGIEVILEKLQPTYRLVVLSNTNFIHTGFWMKEYTLILKYFERIFCSYDMGHRKPEPAVFQFVLDYLQCCPVEVLFIDDNEENVAGARQLGIQSILMNSVDQLYMDLGKLGINL